MRIQATIHSQYSIELIGNDTEYLRTDSLGDILGGDMDDWDFDSLTYNEILKYKEYFPAPSYKDTGYFNGLPLEIMFAEIDGNTVTLKWLSSGIEKFTIERQKVTSSEWTKIGMVEFDGNLNAQSEFKFTDHNIADGIYSYRLKYKYEQKDKSREFTSYEQLQHAVVVKGDKRFEFYPVYPNPVKDKFYGNFLYSSKGCRKYIFYERKGYNIYNESRNGREWILQNHKG